MSRTVKDNRYAEDKVEAKKRANNARRNRLRDLDHDADTSYFITQQVARHAKARTRTTRTHT